MTPRLTLVDAMADPNLFKPWFRDPATWFPWLAFLCALFALPMTQEQLAHLPAAHRPHDAADRDHRTRRGSCADGAPARSFILAVIAVYLGLLQGLAAVPRPRRGGTVMIIARDTQTGARHQALHARPPPRACRCFGAWSRPKTAKASTLRNRVVIEIHTASFRSTRGYTIIAALLDELAFWPTGDDAAEPDSEVINAIRPGMATIPGAMLLCASSPYARRGALWDAHRRHFGKDGDPILVWQARHQEHEPERAATRHRRGDGGEPVAAAAEYGAQFRMDVEAFINREVVNACVSVGVYERAAVGGHELQGVPRLRWRQRRRQHGARHRPQGRHDGRGRRAARGAPAFQSRVRRRAAGLSAEGLSRVHRRGRRLRRRVRARAAEEARHLVRAGEEAEVRPLLRTICCRCSTAAASTCSTIRAPSSRLSALSATPLALAATASTTLPAATMTSQLHCWPRRPRRRWLRVLAVCRRRRRRGEAARRSEAAAGAREQTYRGAQTWRESVLTDERHYRLQHRLRRRAGGGAADPAAAMTHEIAFGAAGFVCGFLTLYVLLLWLNA